MMKELTNLMQVDTRYIAPYNPRCDGAVENKIKTISLSLIKELRGADIFWPLWVPIIQMYTNDKIHSSKKSRPFDLMFGRSSKFPSSSSEVNKEEKDHTNVSINDIDKWKDFQTKVNKIIYPEIVEQIRVEKEKMILRVDKNHPLITPDHFYIGCAVWRTDVTREDKRDAKWVGPYIITKKTAAGNYVLADNDGFEMVRQVPPDQLKRAPTTILGNEESTITTIKSIKDHRGPEGIQREYLIHFTNDTEEWIPHTDLIDVKLIRKYWDDVKKQQKAMEKIQGKFLKDSAIPRSLRQPTLRSGKSSK
jgi:hypothetical protein